MQFFLPILIIKCHVRTPFELCQGKILAHDKQLFFQHLLSIVCALLEIRLPTQSDFELILSRQNVGPNISFPALASNLGLFDNQTRDLNSITIYLIKYLSLGQKTFYNHW